MFDNILNPIDFYFKKQTRTIEEILIWCTENDCSDVYIKVFERPYISRFGKVIELPCSPISKDAWSVFYDRHVLNEANAKYVRQKLLDVSIEIRIPETSCMYGKYDTNFFRYRASFGFSEDKNICTLRMIRPTSPTFDTITYNDQCRDILKAAMEKRSGITIIGGPTGSGKSSTLAASVNSFKHSVLNNKVIITLEDPIENIFASTPSTKIVQKELDRDFTSYLIGIKAALREHPNVIIVGECRDKEVICAAIDASRTGHMTVSSFHASNVAGTLSRLLYYLDNDKNLTYDLIINLNLILCQRMIQSDDRYIVDTQYMLFTEEIKKCLLEAIYNNSNIAVVVEQLLSDEIHLKNKTVKGWDYE